MPMPPPPSVSAETGQSLPKLFCRMNAVSGIPFTIRSRPTAGNYLRQVRSLLLFPAGDGPPPFSVGIGKVIANASCCTTDPNVRRLAALRAGEAWYWYAGRLTTEDQPYLA